MMQPTTQPRDDRLGYLSQRERNRSIVEGYGDDLTLRELGDAYDMTHQGIHRILRKFDVELRPRGCGEKPDHRANEINTAASIMLAKRWG